MNWPGGADPDPRWVQAARDAEQIGAEYPGWAVRPVRRYRGPGVEAWRDSDSSGLCAAMGTAAEVRSLLERVPPARPSARLAGRLATSSGDSS